jgi:DNA-binding CsgD family transcriptional regulator
VIGPEPPPNNLIGTREDDGFLTGPWIGWPTVSGLARASVRFSMRQLFDGMSLDDKRTLLEAILGVSLPSCIVEELESGQRAAPLAPIPGRCEPTQTTRRPATPLTRREWEVAELIAQGLSNREIAGALVICERTAEAHVTHVLTKLGLRSRAQIAVWVAQYSERRVPTVPPSPTTMEQPERSAATWRTRLSRTA